MLTRGFSLLEMLFTIVISSIIVIGIMNFYPSFQLAVIKVQQQNRLEETVHQALSGLVKDIKRAGFLANKLTLITEKAIDINAFNNCIIIRYDLNSVGEWRNNPSDRQNSDFFVYRYYKNNLEYQTGIQHCKSSGWEKLFDSNEVSLTYFYIKNYPHYVEIKLTALLKKSPSITYSIKKYVKTENQ